MEEILKQFTKEELSSTRLLLKMFFSIDVDDLKIKEVVVKQTEKGIKKYGQTIIECPQNVFNWEEMILEEIIDAVIYKLKRDKKI